MYDCLEKFLNHKLIINIRGASVDDLKRLDSIIDTRWRSGDRVYQTCLPSDDFDRYLHCDMWYSYTDDTKEKRLYYCDDLKDDERKKYEIVSLEFFLEECKHKSILDIDSEEFDRLFR